MQPTTLALLVPANRLAAVEKALLLTFNTKLANTIEPLAGGLSASAVYKIEIHGTPYVLKLDEPGKSEAHNSLEIAATAGIAPALFYFDAAEGIAITAFIERKPLRDVFTSPEWLLQQLAKTVKGIHTMPRLAKEGNLLQTVDELVNAFRQSRLLTGPLYDECFTYFEQLREAYPWQDTDKVSSHNDLNPNNIICDGEKIWIIDWDAAFLNDRYVDLAIAANFFVSSDAQENCFLEAYFDNDPDAYKKARFFLMRQVTRLVYALLMFRLAAASAPQGQLPDADLAHVSLAETGRLLGTGQLSLASYEGQLLYGKSLLKEALNCMRSERFTAALEALVV